MRANSMRWIVSVFMIMLTTISPFLPAAKADADMRRVVIGTDLSEEQINAVYDSFEIQRGSVVELFLSNAEEHAVLDGFLDPAIIGTKSMSCVYLELLPQGSGINVTVKNVSWCTPEMYCNAFATAGITDARITVAAPFPVSGTAALAGIYKAYEDMTGQKLDATARDAGTEELTVAGELANEIGSADSASIISELKRMLNETVNLSNEELRILILQIASSHNVILSDAQIQRLMDLCRALEKLNPDMIAQQVEELHSSFEKVSEAKNQVVGFFQTLRQIIDEIMDFFERVSELFGGQESAAVIE